MCFFYAIWLQTEPYRLHHAPQLGKAHAATGTQNSNPSPLSFLSYWYFLWKVTEVLFKNLLCMFCFKKAKHCFCLGIFCEVNKCKFDYITFSLFGWICIISSRLFTYTFKDVKYSSSMFSQIVAGTRNNFVTDLADLGMQTEKGCPPLL